MDSWQGKGFEGPRHAPYSSSLRGVGEGITISFHPKMWASTEKEPGPIKPIATNIAISLKATKFEPSKPQGNVVQTRVATHSRAASGLTIGVKNPITMKTPVNVRRTLAAKAFTLRLECEKRRMTP